MSDYTTGIVLTFGTSALSLELRDVTPPGFNVEALEANHHGMSKGTQFPNKYPQVVKPSDVFTVSNPTLDFWFNKDTNPASAFGIEESITISFPLQSGETVKATWVFNGWLSNYQPGAMPIGQLHQGTGELTVNGEVTITAAT